MTEKLVKQLEKAVEAQDEAKAANLIDRVLATDASCKYALHCRAVLLIHQGKHEAALSALDALSAVEPSYSQDDEFKFQRAYCFYRCQKLQQAAEALAGVQTIPARHLMAQVAYNSEDYATAASIYESLLADNAARDDQERQEIITNLAAAYVTIDAAKATEAVRKADEKTADMLFNAATAELEWRLYDQSIATLSKAEQLALREHAKSSVKSIEGFAALESVPPKSAERALFEDLSPIWVQRAYLHYAKGEEDTSASILSTVLKHRVSSVAVNAVAIINWAAIMRHKDFFDTYRKLKQVQAPAMFSRLTTKQKLLVKYNTAMLHLNIGNHAACKQVAESLMVEHPQSELGPLLALAANVRSEAKGLKKSSAKVEDLLSSISLRAASGKAQQTRLTIAQIRFEQGDVARCLQELAQIEGISKQPGYILTAADWLMRSGEYQKALEHLCSCASGMKDPRSVVVWGAKEFIRRGEYGRASQLLQSFASSDDVELVALAVLAHARTDLDRAVQLSKQLPSPAAAARSPVLDAAPEQLASTLPTRSAVEAAGFKRVGGDEADAAAPAAKAATSRHRPMRRKPKHMNPDVRPDPERWIPMAVRISMKDLPERRKKELRRIRASEQEEKRKAAEKRKIAAAAAASASAPSQ